MLKTVHGGVKRAIKVQVKRAVVQKLGKRAAKAAAEAASTSFYSPSSKYFPLALTLTILAGKCRFYMRLLRLMNAFAGVAVCCFFIWMLKRMAHSGCIKVDRRQYLTDSPRRRHGACEAVSTLSNSHATACSLRAAPLERHS